MNTLQINKGIRALEDAEIELVVGGNTLLKEALKKLIEIFATHSATEWVRNGGIGRLGGRVHGGVMSTGGSVVSGLVRMQDQDFPENP